MPSGGILVFVGCHENWSIWCLNYTLVLRVLLDVQVPSLTYFQLLLELVRGVFWSPHFSAHGVWCCRYLCRRTKVWAFRSFMLPVLLYGRETWTLTRDGRRRLNSVSTRSLQRILVYCWSDFVSNKQLLRGTQMRFVTCSVHKHQLRLYGHVVRFTDADPVHQILSARCGLGPSSSTDPESPGPQITSRPWGLSTNCRRQQMQNRPPRKWSRNTVQATI